MRRMPALPGTDIANTQHAGAPGAAPCGADAGNRPAGLTSMRRFKAVATGVEPVTRSICLTCSTSELRMGTCRGVEPLTLPIEQASPVPYTEHRASGTLGGKAINARPPWLPTKRLSLEKHAVSMRCLNRPGREFNVSASRFESRVFKTIIPYRRKRIFDVRNRGPGKNKTPGAAAPRASENQSELRAASAALTSKATRGADAVD